MLRPLILTAQRHSTSRIITTSTIITTHHPSSLIILPPSKQQQQQQQTRSKHSNRQKKRFFDNNPARHRYIKRHAKQQHQHPTPSTTTTTTTDNNSETPPTTPPIAAAATEPRFPRIFEPVHLPNGWSAPPSSSSTDNGFVMPEYPFTVMRTKGKPNNAVGFLPVYANKRKDGTKVTTIVRRISGDREVFLEELMLAVGIYDREKDVRIRAHGDVIEINGNHVRRVKDWLGGLGF